MLSVSHIRERGFFIRRTSEVGWPVRGGVGHERHPLRVRVFGVQLLHNIVFVVEIATCVSCYRATETYKSPGSTSPRSDWADQSVSTSDRALTRCPQTSKAIDGTG